LAKVAFIQAHFQLMVLAIIVVSLLPMVVHAIQAKRRRGETASDPTSLPAQRVVVTARATSAQVRSLPEDRT
jgi:hypothetical protein